jgi:hypothetical protein
MAEKRHSPATTRNRDPILDVLRRALPPPGSQNAILEVLEVASGSGEHAVWFARALPYVRWLPTDLDPAARESIDAWVKEEGLANVAPAIPLDAIAEEWPVPRADAVVCINMIHISPWAACVGLMGGARRVLPVGGLLFLYGPFKIGGVHTAPSNEAFDLDLRRRDPSWGVRDLDDVRALAREHDLAHEETVAMPANNQSVIFRRL